MSRACLKTINARKANDSSVVECVFKILVTCTQGNEKPDSMATFNGLHQQTLTDLERNDLVESVSGGERHTDPHRSRQE